MIVLSQRALNAVESLKKRYEKLSMIISDTGCCGYSNVHVTTIEPRGDYVYAAMSQEFMYTLGHLWIKSYPTGRS